MCRANKGLWTVAFLSNWFVSQNDNFLLLPKNHDKSVRWGSNFVNLPVKIQLKKKDKANLVNCCEYSEESRYIAAMHTIKGTNTFFVLKYETPYL